MHWGLLLEKATPKQPRTVGTSASCIPGVKLAPFPLSQRTPAAKEALELGLGLDVQMLQFLLHISLFMVFKERKLKMQRKTNLFFFFSTS